MKQNKQLKMVRQGLSKFTEKPRKLVKMQSELADLCDDLEEKMIELAWYIVQNEIVLSDAKADKIRRNIQNLCEKQVLMQSEYDLLRGYYVCPGCGKTVSVKRNYCSECGYDLRVTKENAKEKVKTIKDPVVFDEQKQEETSNRETNGDHDSICWKCFRNIPEGADHCPHCGSDLRDSEKMWSKYIRDNL